MPKSYPVQLSFAAGEVSPKLYGRVDTPGYQSGLMECTNMLVDSRGPVLKRSGFEHLLSYDGNECRLFQFDYSREQTYVVVLKDSEILVSPPSKFTLGPEQIVNPGFRNEDTGWISTVTGLGSVKFNDGSVTLDPSDSAAGSAQIHQTLTVQDLTLDQVIKIRGAFSSPPLTPVQVLVGTSGVGSNDLHSGILSDNGALFQIEIPSPISSATVTVTILAPSQTPGASITTVSEIGLVSFQSSTPAQATYSEVAPYPETDLEAIQSVMHPDGKEMFFVHPNHPVQVLTFDPVAVSWTFLPRTFIDAPTEWVAGNYPGTTTFFQGRHWFAGTPDNPETMWASKSAIYDTFTLEVTPNPDDALRFTISEHGLIYRLTGSKDLLVGTALKEFIVTSNEGVITPADVKVEQQSAYGSAPIQGELLGTESLFVSSDNSKLRAQWYQWTEAGYLARDITYVNDHITANGIRHMTYQREPEQIIWLPLKDGSLVGCTYHRDGNDKPVYGWHHHRLKGVVLDCAAVQEEERTALAAAMLLTIGGVNRVHIMVAGDTVDLESLGGVAAKSGPDVVYLDDYVTIISNGVDTTVSGLDHLEGLVVQTVNDGAVENLKIVAGGSITLDNPGVEISVGIPYTGSIKTLPLVVDAGGGSTTMEWSKNRPRIFIRTLASAKPLINGVRPAERTAQTPMDTPQAVESADFYVAALGWDESAIVAIEQDLPKPLNIIAIMGDVVQETL